MKLLKSLILLAGCLAFISCDTQSTSSSKDSDAPQGKVAKYLASLDYDYDKILAKEEVLKIIPIQEPSKLEIKVDDAKATGSPEYGAASYEWPSDRPNVKMSPHMPPMPDMNNVRISNLSFESGDVKSVRSSFENSYRAMSQAEIADAKKRLEKSFEGKSAKDLKTAKGFIEARGKSKSQHVDGIGDSAYWHPTSVMDHYLGVQLIVLSGNAKFSVTAKVSAEDEDNLKVAKKIAKAIIDKAG